VQNSTIKFLYAIINFCCELKTLNALQFPSRNVETDRKNTLNKAVTRNQLRIINRREIPHSIVKLMMQMTNTGRRHGEQPRALTDALPAQRSLLPTICIRACIKR
jgi:hypothetical protein